MRWTIFAFALRVPLSCALTLALLAPLGAFSFSPMRGMLEGLFDVSGWGAFWVGMASWLSAAACWVCSLLTLNYGPRRIAGLHRTETDVQFRRFPGLALALSAAPLSILAGVYQVSANGPAVVAGSAAGFATSLLGWLAHRALVSRRVSPSSPLIDWLLSLDPIGYRDRFTRQLLPGHRLALQFTIFFVALWGFIGLMKYQALLTGSKSVMLPTSLTFAILLIGLLALILSGLAFFFDRYRVPVLMPWIALLAVTSLIPSADQFVETLPAAAEPLLRPAQLLTSTSTPVLVCASGGGIAAAAWAAAVLSGLDRQSPQRFNQSLALFSGASGGSVGGMHFIAACRSPVGCDSAFDRASRSSLDAAAWGLVGPDLLRATVPFAGSRLGNIGRGWALEQAWDPEGDLRFPLSAWATGPAVVFNATLVETGEGVGLANVDLEPALPSFQTILRNEPQRVDLSPVAAARMSASFPFVTPTPRPREVAYHFADGGYYDNYGVGAAVAFLQLAYAVPTPLPRRVLLIEIRARRAERHRPGSISRLLFQWHSPADTILNSRDTAQRDRNDTTLHLLTLALAARGVTLDRVVFEIPRSEVPLSWHLTAAQMDTIRHDWRDRFENSPETRAVTEFLAQRP